MASLLPLLLLVLCPLPGGGGDEELERARKLLGESEEQTYREGTDLCVSLDSVAAAELLLDTLRLESDRGGYLPSAHYRDLAWDALRRMSAGPPRARVEQELAKNRKSALLRQWCAELLGEYGSQAFAESLMEALEDKDLGVRRAAARALGKLSFASGAGAPDVLALKVVATLAKHAGDKDPVLRTNAREAALRLDPRDSVSVFRAGMRDEDAGARCALLAAAAEIDRAKSAELAVAALQDPDWRPRMQAVDVLGALDTKEALRHMIAALGDARPAVVARARHHLQEITGLKHTRKEAWEAWWKENGDGFDFSGARKKEALTPDSTVAASFNGIVFESDHAAFLIDVSADMAGTLASRQCSKAEAAQQELAETLERLRGRLSFSLYTYAREITPFSKKGPVELTEKTREKALDFVREQRLEGSKNIWEALETVLADPTVDTVFLLSSGEPEVGLYVHWNRVAWHLKELNRFRKVVVHAIAYSDDKWYREQIEKIAEATGGEFKYFE